MLCRGSALLADHRSTRSGLGYARPGFTLFELMLVCAVIAVLGAMVYPSIDGMYATYRVGACADEVRAAWALARSHAMDESRPYRFSIKPNTGDYRVAPDASPYWMGSDEPQSDDDPMNPPLIKQESLPSPIVFRWDNPGAQAPTDPTDVGDTSTVGRVDGSWTTLAVFLPDGSAGSAQNDVNVKLDTTGAKPTIIKLRALTGVVTIRTPVDEAKAK
ncbi:MAG TPA: prepilin-type N-terminal cleavage/methylation domain-containing protein [Gemmataceae bacterium]|jgi:prepilin-type N-terminal cleavage/methylation domain-containing protein|nr:prepilin-type N-terminal cleavage/methylation domain-containing protein [Gemmataceae bacterium]